MDRRSFIQKTAAALAACGCLPLLGAEKKKKMSSPSLLQQLRLRNYLLLQLSFRRRLVRSLQAYFARHEDSGVSVRELKDALDEAFHPQGGIRYLHRLCPGGPVAQGCRLAGLAVPPGAVDPSFGSVQ